MADNKSDAFSPDYSSELNIESIISAPLIAASKANVVMAAGQTRFLLDYCFFKNKNNAYEPVMVDMVMKKGIIDPSKDSDDPEYIKIEKMIFSVPILCLVPLSSLAIDKVNVDFDMEITSMTSHQPKDTDKVNLTQRTIIDKKTQLNGKIAKRDKKGSPVSGQYKSQSTSRLEVNINAGPLPLPVGLLTILDLYTKAIQPLPQKE